MTAWFSLNKLFSTHDSKIGIDLRTNNGYVIAPPSVHPSLNKYEFVDVDANANIRDKIQSMPEWLYQKICDYFAYLDSKQQLQTHVKVANGSTSLRYMQERLKTPELCKLAVENNGYMLQYVPERLKTPELCGLAVKNYGCTLQYVPEQFKTPEMCKSAVEESGVALRFVPTNIKKLLD